MSDSSSELKQLHKDLCDTDKALEEGLRKEASTWSWGIGRLKTGPRTIYPTTVATIFAILIVLALISGILLISLGVQSGNLGGPLIVGALFSAGAFVSQFWAVGYQRYQEIRNFVFENEWNDVKELAQKKAMLLKEIEKLQGSADKLHHKPKEG